MSSDEQTKAASEFQKVLTRFIDSEEGYAHAATLVSDAHLSAIFLEISETRTALIPRLRGMIKSHGSDPEITGSPEGSIHRWWMSLRDTLTNDELKDVLIECIRGESSLLEAMDNAIASGNLDGSVDEVVRLVRIDVNKAVAHFTAAVHEGEFS